jgi:DNA-binding CsgD family transcriptional regulator
MAPQDLGSKMDVLIRLTAIQLVGDLKGADAIALLARAGLDNDVIAEIVGTTPATVRAALSRVRRRDGAQQKSSASVREEGV